MIKNLKNKFLICLFLLVAVFSVTSSCFAVFDSGNVISASELDIPLDRVFDYLHSLYDNNELNIEFNEKSYYICYSTRTGDYRFAFVPFEDFETLLIYYNTEDEWYYGAAYNSAGEHVKGFYKLDIFYNAENDTIFHTLSLTGYPCFDISDSAIDNNYLRFVDSSTVNISYETLDNNIFSNSSFSYEITGVKRGQVKLTINNLDSSLRMYGYVGLESYPDGEILDTSVNINNLRLLATKTDNSDLYCYLYEGEELTYYIVNENNVILDAGYISEMAKGYFLYGFEVNNGVDFVFLKDGQVYWDNNLIFKYNVNNSNTIQNNDIVSMGQYSYIETNKAVSNGTYKGYVYDSTGNLLNEASCKYSNDLSTLSIKVDTSYYEVETLFKHYSCYWLQTIYLTGNNSDGTSIDFSNYYVNWSVPTWVDFDKIELGQEEYNKRSGTLTGFTSSGALSMFNLKFFEYLNVHTKSFDITLQVYDGNDNLVLTHVINSDNIISKQVASEENNVDKGDYGILDNPGYTGGSNNSSNIGNIQNWTADDYLNLMSTDNFVWEFFKAILGNLPWWITTPLTILIFGVVIITIIRFARGA